MYFKINSCIKLLNNESKPAFIELGKECENVATLFVYHITLPVIESENDDDMYDRDEQEYSDEEFYEIRKKSRQEKVKLDELAKESCIVEWSGYESGSSYNSGSLNYNSSEEESDDDICYATPPNYLKRKCVDELFNDNILARDIKWKVGLIFAYKKQLKNDVRSCSMETGRPYHCIVDDLKRVQVGCAKSYPFKMWD